MKKGLLVVVVLWLMGATAFAANQWTKIAIAYVPFDFVVSDTVLPAGNYAVLTSSDGGKIIVRNTDTWEAAITLNNNVTLKRDTVHPDTKLMFALDTSQQMQMLHQIYVVGDDHSHDLVHDGS